MNTGTPQAQTTRNPGKLAGWLFGVALLFFSAALSAQEAASAAAPGEAVVPAVAPGNGSYDPGDDVDDENGGTGDISELSDEEAAQKAEAARRDAEEKGQQAERERQAAGQAQDRADRVRDVQEKIDTEAVEGPPEAADQRRRESVHSAAEAAEQEAAQQAQAAEQAEKEYKESAAHAEVLEKAADPETGKIYRSLDDREGGPIFGIRFNAAVAIDAARYQNGSVLAGSNSIDLRRFRVGLYRGFGVNWYARLTLEVSSGQVQPRDNFAGYRGWPTALLQFGIFSEPFSLESMTSFNYTTFMEKALPVAALTPGKSVGVGATKRTDSGIFTGGIFLKRPQQEGNVGEDGEAITLRYVRSPMWRPEAQNTHFGMSVSYRTNATTEGTRYQTRPESNVTGTSLIDTGNIEGANEIIRVGADFSRLWGPKSLQGEIMALQVQRSDGFPNVTFGGAYIFGSLFLTGESRNYREGTGVYGAIRPLAPLGGGGKGAFELTARLSYLDLTDEDIVGGKQTNITAGVNWYPKEAWRFSANLIKVLNVNRPGNEFDGQDPWIFTIRGQYLWHQ